MAFRNFYSHTLLLILLGSSRCGRDLRGVIAAGGMSSLSSEDYHSSLYPLRVPVPFTSSYRAGYNSNDFAPNTTNLGKFFSVGNQQIVLKTGSVIT